MNFSLYIAKRYLRSKSSNNAINFITIIALIGIILGAASLFIVLSGFAGLKSFTLQFSSIIDPQIKAEAAIGKSFILTPEEEKEINKINNLVSFSKIIEEQVIVSFDNKNYPARIKGVDDNYKNIASVDSLLIRGNWFTQGENQIVVGWGISNNLSFNVLDYGKRINLYVPKIGKGQVKSVRDAFSSVKAINVGIFDINEALNDTYVFAPIDLVRHLLSYNEDQVSAIEFKLKDNYDEGVVRQKIKAVLGDKVNLKNKNQLNDAIHKMLNTENLMVYLIFTLVLIIALFNVIGSLIMMLLDKKQTLKTLFNLGATIKDLRRIFFIQGSLMTIIGGFVGLLIGLGLVLIQKVFGLVMITSSLPYPVSIEFKNLVLVFVTLSVFGIIASKIASTRVALNLIKNI